MVRLRPVWMTNHPPLLLWHCWLGHKTCENHWPYNLLLCWCRRKTMLNQSSWWTIAHQYPTSPTVNGYVLPVVAKSLYHVTGSVPMDVGHLLLLGWLSGTLPDDMRNPEVSEDGYRQSMKTFLVAQYQCIQRFRFFFTRMHYLNPHLTFDNSILFLSGTVIDCGW